MGRVLNFICFLFFLPIPTDLGALMCASAAADKLDNLAGNNTNESFLVSQNLIVALCNYLTYFRKRERRTTKRMAGGDSERGRFYYLLRLEAGWRSKLNSFFQLSGSSAGV